MDCADSIKGCDSFKEECRCGHQSDRCWRGLWLLVTWVSSVHRSRRIEAICPSLMTKGIYVTVNGAPQRDNGCQLQDIYSNTHNTHASVHLYVYLSVCLYL